MTKQEKNNYGLNIWIQLSFCRGWTKDESGLQFDKKMSPSDISTIFNKLKVKGIINGSKTIEYEDILLAIFEYEGKDEAQDKLIFFLNTNGVSQAKIVQKLNVSARLVRNVLSKK